MTSKNSILEDITKLASNAAAVAFDACKDTSENIKDKTKNISEKITNHLDLVTREEFDVLRALVQNVITENEQLKAKITELESKIK